MKTLLLIIGSLFLFSFYSCNKETNEEHHNQQTTANKDNNKKSSTYSCPESDILIEGTAQNFDNLRKEFDLRLTGKVSCGGNPLPGARVNVKFPDRETNLNITTDSAGTYKTQINRLKESPENKTFTVTLLTPDDKPTQNIKEFKVPAAVK